MNVCILDAPASLEESLLYADMTLSCKGCMLKYTFNLFHDVPCGIGLIENSYALDELSPLFMIFLYSSISFDNVFS